MIKFIVYVGQCDLVHIVLPVGFGVIQLCFLLVDKILVRPDVMLTSNLIYSFMQIQLRTSFSIFVERVLCSFGRVDVLIHVTYLIQKGLS